MIIILGITSTGYADKVCLYSGEDINGAIVSGHNEEVVIRNNAKTASTIMRVSPREDSCS